MLCFCSRFARAETTGAADRRPTHRSRRPLGACLDTSFAGRFGPEEVQPRTQEGGNSNLLAKLNDIVYIV